ncbi:hypothetical protein ES703_66604 [subsurface metagenome]
MPLTPPTLKSKVSELITSLKVALTVAVIATLVALASGIVLTTVGGVMSTVPVVKLHTLASARGRLARSFTAPAGIVTS